MPMYDFECPHGHRFEKVVLIADRNNPVPCEATVPQLCEYTDEGSRLAQLPNNVVVMKDGKESADVAYVKDVPCILKATRVEISHSSPASMLDYGLGANRDAAREGRYDGTPSTRGVRK